MGRKPGTSQNERLLRAEIARALSTAIGTKRGAISKAAGDLQVTKQALSLYLRQKATPGAEVLRRICKLWKLQLNVRGALVDADGLLPARQESQPEQLSLFAALAEVQDAKLDVTILRKHESSIDLKVSINFD
jgi:transcriptional regulator with XRE-family HTH domain